VTLNPKQFRFHLYHGTSASNLDRINASGLGGNVGGSNAPTYLTNDPELAEIYAHNHEDPVVLKVAVRPKDLEVDEKSFEMPVEGYNNSRSFDESKLRHETKDWANSLRQTGAVVHRGVINPEHIIDTYNL
jgi:hypothetical protein